MSKTLINQNQVESNGVRQNELDTHKIIAYSNVVFENEKPTENPFTNTTKVEKSKTVSSIWNVIGTRVDGKTFTWQMEKLIDFSKSEDKTQSSFAGEISYTMIINNDGNYTHLDLGNVNGGITELYINDVKTGKRWYGKATYEIENYLKKGENKIEIKYTTVLANYCKSLNNPLTNRWTRNYKDLKPLRIRRSCNIKCVSKIKKNFIDN